MEGYLNLAIAAALAPLATIMFYYMEKKTSFKEIDWGWKQFSIGIIFGMIAIAGNEWGIMLNGAMVNCRDAAPLVAGLFFGGPAGIIAGLMGGIERWFCVYWGGGTFTRVACSVSTIFAGFYAAALRKGMFEDKRPSWGMAFCAGVVMEVLHLTMVFVTNSDEAEKGVAVVKSCATPMILAVGTSVLLSSVAVTFMSGEKFVKVHDNRLVSQVQKWMLVSVVIGFFISVGMLYAVQTGLSVNDAKNMINLAVKDEQTEIRDIVKQNPGANVDAEVQDQATNRHIGNNGVIVVLDKDFNIIGGWPKYIGKNVSDSEFASIIKKGDFGSMKEVNIAGTDCYTICKKAGGYYVAGILTSTEVFEDRDSIKYVNAFMMILVFAMLFAMIYVLIKRSVIKNLKEVNKALAQISSGNLDVEVKVNQVEEFASLSRDINETVDTLKSYIDEAKARIDKELQFAKDIQHSAIPSMFPAYPGRTDFDIYASMDTAKEVGGDFYDFYFSQNNILNILIADVSGKGIPAAMFMMRGKVQLKSLTDAGEPLAQVFTDGNNSLCEGNDAGMFITGWQGQVNLEEGGIKFVNAGHNPPLVKHAGGEWEYLISRAGLVLAGMEGVKYREQEIPFGPGDTIFLYTDGVTEATDSNDNLYGEDRLRDLLNSRRWTSMEEMCKVVREDIDIFVGDAPQFDDITMLAFKYNGNKLMEFKQDEATLEDIPMVTERIEEELGKLDCPMKTIIHMNIAIDELYSNIVKFAYGGKKGPAKITLSEVYEPHGIQLTLMDEGMPYNPLDSADPDTTLSAEERGVGGLGLYMVKKTFDDMVYSYQDGKNVVKIIKHF